MSDKMRVADFIAEFVKSKGVNDVFLLPGGGAMYLVDAFGKLDDMKVVPCHHEQTCSIAAESYARITENFGVAVVTTGPGATNAITGVVGAWIESVPMMVISGQVKRSDMIGERKIRQGGVQEVDIISMVKNCTKYAITVDDAKKVKQYLQEAYYLMMEGRQGPVWIDVPLDVQGAMIDPNELAEFAPPKEAQKNSVTDGQIKKVIELINSSERPIILLGHGVRLSGATNLFRDLAKSLNIPIVATWNAMDIIDYQDDLFVGKPGVVASRAPNFAIQNSDLLISIGSRLDNVITAYNPKNFAKHAKKVVVDIDENELKKEMVVDVSICTDAKIFLEVLKNNIASVKIKERQEWLDRCKHWKQKYGINDGKPFEGDEISHFQFAYALSQELKCGEIVATGSSGLGLEAFYVGFETKPNQRVFLTSGLGSMGYGLPSAIGACIANNRAPIIAVESDGSLQLNIQEFATIKGLNLPICLFIIDNDGYSSIRNTQKNYFNSRFVAIDKESGLNMPDLEALCSAYGIGCSVVLGTKNLNSGIRKALEAKRPYVCIVKTKKEETLLPKCSAMPQPDGSIISMPLEDMSPLLSLEVLKEEMIVPLSEESLKIRR